MNNVLDIKAGDRILVSRSDRLGDLILALPFVETLKSRYPDCQVDVMASLYASPILENNPLIDGIVRVQNDQLISNNRYRKDLERKIKMAGYSVVVALFPERNICRVFHRAGIPCRLGTAGRFHSVFFTHRLRHSRKANKKHESAYNLDFLKYFVDGDTVTMPTVYPTDKELMYARKVLRDAGVDKSCVVVHPGSGGSAERWSMEKFMELIPKLEQAGFQVVITGSEAEGEAIREASGKAGVKVNCIAGDTDLRTLGAVLSQASVVVANSTGPLHLAVSVGTKVVGLYPGRRIMSPVRWGPVGKGHQVLQPTGVECKCPPKQCRCINTISVESVAGAVGKAYESSNK